MQITNHQPVVTIGYITQRLHTLPPTHRLAIDGHPIITDATGAPIVNGGDGFTIALEMPNGMQSLYSIPQGATFDLDLHY